MSGHPQYQPHWRPVHVIADVHAEDDSDVVVQLAQDVKKHVVVKDRNSIVFGDKGKTKEEEEDEEGLESTTHSDDCTTASTSCSSSSSSSGLSLSFTSTEPPPPSFVSTPRGNVHFSVQVEVYNTNRTANDMASTWFSRDELHAMETQVVAPTVREMRKITSQPSQQQQRLPPGMCSRGLEHLQTAEDNQRRRQRTVAHKMAVLTEQRRHVQLQTTNDETRGESLKLVSERASVTNVAFAQQMAQKDATFAASQRCLVLEYQQAFMAVEPTPVAASPEAELWSPVKKPKMERLKEPLQRRRSSSTKQVKFNNTTPKENANSLFHMLGWGGGGGAGGGGSSSPRFAVTKNQRRF